MPRWLRIALVATVAALAIGGVFGLLWMATPEPVPRERVHVLIEMPGAGAREMDTEIGEPLARALSAIDPAVEITSRDGRVDAVLTLEDRTIADVRDRVEALIPALPDDASHPAISRVPDGPVVRWIVRGERAGDRQRHMIAHRVRSIRGVVRVDSCALQREIEILIDPARLAAYALDASVVVDAIAASNEEVAGGYIERGTEEVLVRSTGRSRSVQDLAQIVIAERGSVVRVSDIATVSDTYSREGCRCLVAGERCASGTARLASEAARAQVRAVLTEEGATMVEDRIAVSLIGSAEPIAARITELPAAVEIAPEIVPGERSVDVGVLLLDGSARPRVEEEIVLSGGRSQAAAETIDIVGDDIDAITALTEDVELALHRAGYAVASDEEPQPTVAIDRERLEREDVALDDALRAIVLATEGEIATELFEGHERISVRVRVDGGVDQLRVRSRTGAFVPVIGGSSTEREAQVVRRCGVHPCLRLWASGGHDARGRLAELRMPNGVWIAWSDDE